MYYVSELLRNPHNGHFYLVLSYVSYVSSSVLLTFHFEKESVLMYLCFDKTNITPQIKNLKRVLYVL